jgi:uncharacterized membrane protein
LAVFFIAAGVLHFVRPDVYARIVPPALPWPLAIVQVSGGFEILGGCAVLSARTCRLAGHGLIVLLVAVFPANVYMALHPAPVAGVDVPIWLLWLRLPLQGALIAWVWWATRSVEPPER